MFAAVYFLGWMKFLHNKSLVQPFKQAMSYNKYCALEDLYYISNQTTRFYFKHCSVKELAYQFTFVVAWVRYVFLKFYIL